MLCDFLEELRSVRLRNALTVGGSSKNREGGIGMKNEESTWCLVTGA